MKKLISIAALAGALALTGPVAQAQDTGLYVGLKTSLFFSPKAQNNLEIKNFNTLNQKLSTGFGLNAAVGYDWGKYLRTEFEFGYKFQKADSLYLGGQKVVETNGKVRQFTMMSNIYVDVPVAANFEVFAGAGLGISVIGAHNYTVEGQDIKIIKGGNAAFTYQFMAGVSYGLASNLDLVLEYRYTQTVQKSVKNDTGFGIKADFNAHNMGVGVRFKF